MASGPSSRDRAGQPRVLIVTPGEIAYDTNAGHGRLWSVAQALIAEGADVGYFGIWPLAHRQYAKAMADCGIQLVGERPPIHDLSPEAAAQRERPEVTTHRFSAAIKVFQPTHIYLYLHVTAMELLDVARTTARDSVVFVDAVDVLFRQAWSESNPSPMTKEDELALYNRADAVLVDSHTDSSTLLGVSELNTPVVVVPLVYEPQPGPGWAEREGLLFIGTSDHPPNVDAALWFVTDILPRVRDTLTTRTTIVGSDRKGRFGSLAGPDVTVAGWVPDLAQTLITHRLAIAPLRQGGGLRGKVLESLSVGLPVVTTEVATYGIPPGPDKQPIGTGVPNDPQAFADALIAMYTNEHTWQQQRESGLGIIQEHFSWQRLRTVAAQLLGLAPR